jgi:hypothetical protein
MAVRICRSMSAPTSRARNWQQKIASMRAGSRSQIGSASWTLLSRWWTFQVGLVPVGGEHLLVGELPVVGDQREAAIAGGVVGDGVVAGSPADGVPGAGGAPVAGVGAGPTTLLLPEALFDALVDGDLQPAGGSGVGQRLGDGLLDGGAGPQPGLGPGQSGGQLVDGGGAGLDSAAAGVLVAGGLDGGVDPDDAVPSAEGSGAGKVDQTLSRSPIRCPGSRIASVHDGWLVPIQSRNHLSSPRVRGSTVTNRPPAPSMCRIACPEHSFESATYRKSRRPNTLTRASQVGMCVGSSLVLPSASR